MLIKSQDGMTVLTTLDLHIEKENDVWKFVTPKGWNMGNYTSIGKVHEVLNYIHLAYTREYPSIEMPANDKVSNLSPYFNELQKVILNVFDKEIGQRSSIARIQYTKYREDFVSTFNSLHGRFCKMAEDHSLDELVDELLKDLPTNIKLAANANEAFRFAFNDTIVSTINDWIKKYKNTHSI